MNVSDMQVPDEDERIIVMMSSLAAKRSKRKSEFGRSILRFANKQEDRERANLDQSGHQQDCATAFGTRH